MLSKLPKSKTNITRIYIGDFKEFGGSIDTNISSISDMMLNLNKIDDIETNNFTQTIYQYNDLYLYKIGPQLTHFRETQLFSKIYDNYCVTCYSKDYINQNEFPIINEYTSVSKQDVIIYNYKESINISFIEENEKINYTEIKFINKGDDVLSAVNNVLDILLNK